MSAKCFLVLAWIIPELLTPCSSALDLIGAQTRGDPNGVTVSFSAAVSEASATNPAHYVLNHHVTVSNVVMLETSKIRLETYPLAEGQVYTLTVNGVEDRADPPNPIPPASQIALVQSQGIIPRKEFDAIGGTLVLDLTNNVKFPSQPDSVSYLTSLEAPSNIGDNYGQQILGFVTAPLTGDYTFYIASDDQSVLYLSQDANPANNQLIASEPGYNAARLWIGGANGRLQIPTNFVAGDFFVEAEDFDYGGGQHMLAADSMPYLGHCRKPLTIVRSQVAMGPLSQKHGIKRAADWVVPATWNQGRVGTV